MSHRAFEPVSSPMNVHAGCRHPGTGAPDVPSATKQSPTAADHKYLSPYNRRLNLVVATIQQHEKLNDKAAAALAVHVLHTLDHVPERVR
jgi:Family of unknown function (DUF6307)